MSIIPKFLLPLLFLVVLPFQKTKDKCLIIKLKDNTESYKIGTIGNLGEIFYISLKYQNPKKNKEYENPLVDILAPKNPTGVSYNLQNKEEINNLPDNIYQCNCATVNNFNLGMEFKVYVEKEDGWVTFDAKKLLVEE